MNRAYKILLILFSLVLLSIFLSVITIYYFIASHSLTFDSVQQFVLTNNYAQRYLFWVSVIFAALTVIALLVILFYPKKVTKFILQEKRGQLSLDKRAIEGFVRTSIKQEDFMDNPKVHVTATKKKLNVQVRGQLKKTSDLIGQTNHWAQKVETTIHNLLGPEEKVTIQVTLQTFEPVPTKTTMTRPRVE